MHFSIELFIYVVCVSGASYVAAESSRTITTTVITCSSNDTHVNISHTKSIGEGDMLHFVHASQGAPTVIVAQTLLPANLTVNCDAFLSGHVNASGSVQLVPTPKLSVALSFTKLIQFNDTDKTADLNRYAESNSSWIKTYSLSNVNCDLNVNNDGSHSVQLKLTGIEGISPLNRTSSVTFKFHMYTMEGLSSDLPHLEYRDNVTLVDVTLDNLITGSITSRFAVEMVLTKSTNVGNDMNIRKEQSIDDETSPGSFSVVNWEIKGPKARDDEPKASDDVAFLRWRPSCFTDSKRSVPTIIKTNYYSLTTYNMSRDDGLYSGLAYAFYGDAILNVTNVHASNVSFGSAGDDQSLFYNSTGYNTWMLSIGFGAPPVERISLLIILICAIGLGIPFLLLFAAGVFMIVRRIRLRMSNYSLVSSSYAEIN